MGDILGSIFGTSSTQAQTTTPDPFQQAMNYEKLNQLVNFFRDEGAGPLLQYAYPQQELTTPSAFSTDIASVARNNMLRSDRMLNEVSLPTLDDYRRGFDPVTGSYNDAIARLYDTTGTGQAQNARTYGDLANYTNRLTEAGLNRSYSDYNTGVTGAGQTYGQVSGDIQRDYDSAIARGDYDYARALLQSEANYGRNMGTTDRDLALSLDAQGYNRQQALDLGLDTTGGYIDQIATPRINQAMTLQGLERGGAVPAAIARATAEYALPYLQSIENIYGTNVANTIAQYMQQRGAIGTNTQDVQAALGQAQAQQNAALGGQLMSLQGAAGNTYQNNVAQLAQALMSNNITLEQAGIAANSALGQQLMQAQNSLRLQQQQGITSLASTYLPQQAAYQSAIPQVGAQLAALPLALQGAQAQTLSTLMPIADFSRQLRENDFLRRQGLATSVYTGIPFQPGSQTNASSGTGNIFDQLGGTISSGVTGGQGGFSTLGTKT